MPPLPPQKVHPNYQRFFFIKDKDSEKLKTECFNPLLRGIKIDNSAKLLANKACDKEVYETLESCKWRESKGRVDNPSAYFCIVLRQKIMKNRGLRI